MNCATSRSLYFGSGRRSRLCGLFLLGILRLPLDVFRSFGTVATTTLAAGIHPACIQSSAYHVVANPRKVLDPASPNEDDGVFLKIMALSGNIGCHLDAVGQPNAGNFTQSRVRLFRCSGINTSANAPSLGTTVEGRGLGLPSGQLSSHPNDLIDCRQQLSFHFKT